MIKSTTMAMNPYDPESPKTKKHLKDLRTPWKLWLYFFKHLPSVLFFGVRLKSLTPYKAEVTIPFKWRTQNPFRSIYAGGQFAAAELSTGLMAGHIIYGRGRITMLITKTEIEYVKKATSLTTFTCDEGQKLLDAVQKAIDKHEPQEITVLTIGTQADGQMVSRMKFTWSFKHSG
jgi:acyl-coenzyme A thioesterase PaaI-like protein